MTKNLWGLTLHIDLPILWLQQLPTVTVNPKDVDWLSRTINVFFKGRKTTFFPNDIRPLPKAGPRKSQNVNKKKITTAILTDTSVKNAVKKYNARLGANEKNWSQEKRKEKRVQHFY